MSNLSKLYEAQSWVSSWRGHYKNRPGGVRNLARRLRQAADEQAINFRRRPDAEYARSVAYLEKEARRAEKACAPV